MTEKQRIKQYGYLFGVFVAIFIVFLFVAEIQGAIYIKEGLSHFFMGIVMYAVYTYIIIGNEKAFGLDGRRMNGMYICTVVVGILFILSGYLPVYQLWLSGCIIAALIYGTSYGIATLIVYTGIFGICNELPVSEFLLYLVPGAVIIFLISFYPGKKGIRQVITSYIYSAVIAVCCQVSIYMIINELDIHKLFCFESIMMIIYTFILITAIYVYMMCISRLQSQEVAEPESENVVAVEDEPEPEIEQAVAEPELESTATVEDEPATESAATVEDEPATESTATVEDESATESVATVEDEPELENDLLDRLKENHPEVYRHSVIIAKLSGFAAKAIGADADKAVMAAMYHEIGKISDNEDYIAEGVRLAEEYRLSDCVVNVIESHRHGNVFPATKEAAVVYFSVMIINSVKHMMSVGQKSSMSTDALIDNIFRLRLRDGFLNDSGLTIFEYNTLKEFYIDYFAEKS